jgi:hypothetical protein
MNLTTVVAFISELLFLIGLIIPVIVRINRVANGQKCQLRHDMLQIYYGNKDTGIIRQYEYENFVMLYEAYKALGGNSFIDKIYDEVKKWKIIT